MTTYHTGNPLGSAAVQDLYDNAQNLDVAVNDRASRSWVDRLGAVRQTFHGMEQTFEEFLLSSGYVDIGDYASGLILTARNQVFSRGGNLYRANAALSLPYITTGDWGAEGGNFVAVGDAALRQDLAGPGGAALVGFLQRGLRAVRRTLQETLGESASITDWMTPEERAAYASYRARDDFDGCPDMRESIQAAIDATWLDGRPLYAPPGAGKIVGTLEIPNAGNGYEDRGDAWAFFGAGAAQVFVQSGYKGTAFISKTDAPILRYRQTRAMPTSSAAYSVRKMRFQQDNADASAPVVLLDSLCEDSEFSRNQIYQAGTGDGLVIRYQIKGNIERNFAMNRDWLELPSVTHGVGFRIESEGDSGLLTLRKNSARGFQWGYIIGDGEHDASGSLLVQNEASVCENGMWIAPRVSSATLLGNYFEGIRETCVLDQGTATVVQGGKFYTGFKKGIDSTAPTYGNRYSGNYLETAGFDDGTSVILIDIASAGASGGPSKSIAGGTVLFSRSGGSIAGVRGIRIAGDNPRLDISGVAFEPRGPWIGGAGTIKVEEAFTGAGVAGMRPVFSSDQEFPHLGQGSISLGLADFSLSQLQVSGGALTLPRGGSLFTVNASEAVAVNAIEGGAESGRLIVLRLENTNMTFQSSALLQLAGSASYSGPGILTLLTQRIASTTYAYEVSRA